MREKGIIYGNIELKGRVNRYRDGLLIRELEIGI
jgi:hypothetical protein